MSDIRSLPLALAALLLTVGAAFAAPGLATTDVNVRQGPGMNFPVVATIPGDSNTDGAAAIGLVRSIVEPRLRETKPRFA